MRALGVDVASKHWKSVGFALVEWDGERWTGVDVDFVTGSGALTPKTLAATIDRVAFEQEVAIVSLDGPQGWREPDAPPRKGCGRVSEYAARTQGKTGEYGLTFPFTQRAWMEFSIETFEHLLSAPGVELLNDAALAPAPPPSQGYWLVECYPTETWRTLGIRPLPGKASASTADVAAWGEALRSRVGLPPYPRLPGHDGLQAVLAALAGAACVGAPLRPKAYGQPARVAAARPPVPAHRVEGLIWTACLEPPAEGLLQPGRATAPQGPGGATPGLAAPTDPPLLPDERSEAHEDVLGRGVQVFEELVALANAGDPQGISYGYFVALLHGVKDFTDVTGRRFLPSDLQASLELAQAVTEAAGGRKKVTRNGVTLEAGMDTFLWSEKATRSAKAWQNPRFPLPYSQAEWRAVFPDGERRVRTSKQPRP